MNLLIDPEAMAAWKAHPGTVAFRQYLRDFRAKMAENWASGNPMSDKLQAQADLMGQMADLGSDAVANFYGVGQDDGH